MDLKISQAQGLHGTIEVPGDKSISHRALLVGALAEGETRILGFLRAADTLSTLRCLEMLGVEIEEKNTELVVHGVGLSGFKEPSDVLNVGNSGTTLRVLPGILAGQKFFSVLTGDDSVRQRPMDRVIRPLCEMGASIWAKDKGTRAPIAIQGEPLRSISYTTPIPSAQVKSAILLAGLLAEGETSVQEKSSSRDHTERILKAFGAKIDTRDRTSIIVGKSILKPIKINIPGDISSAAFFIVGALITSKSELVIKNVGMNPTRTGILEILSRMGARIEQMNNQVINGEPWADLVIKSSKLTATIIEKDLIPKLIDELPIIAIVATQAQGTTIVRDAQELRVKETDRISAMCSELKKLNADITEMKDGFIINGPCQLKGNRCSSYGDHRMAMALAIAGLVAGGETVVENAECIEVSFPGFQETLERVIR